MSIEIISAQKTKECYRNMLLLRRFEEKASQLYVTRLISGFCHLYIGQEAVGVGVQQVRKPQDSVITSYRDHGIMLASKADPKVVMAELLGRNTGCSKGKGGSMHIFDTKNGFYGGHGIVGAQVPIGTGIAFAHKYRNEQNICFTYLGDGAVNQGQVYESFNMAALWKLPVIYIIENNQYAMGTAVARSTANPLLYKRGDSFGIPGYLVNGMNLFEVIKTTHEAAEYCRAGNGPVLLEMDTYRYRGHSMSDPGKYRTKEEIQDVRKNKDPLQYVEDYLIQNNFATKEELTQYNLEIKKIITETVEFAKNSLQPDNSELYTDVYQEQ